MISKIREYSIPLLLGVVIAILWANLSPETYYNFVYTPIFGEEITFHFLINDVFMVFFFAIAGVEIVHSLAAGGALNPIDKAVTPLMAMAGGVVGPIIVFFSLNALIGTSDYLNGWGVCTATDIALAWLLARIVFGKYHPAVSFLLLLAVADDAIGLVIIAVFYPDPNHTIEPMWLGLVVIGSVVALFMRRSGITAWGAYIFGAGLFAWFGMYNAHLHPALALIFIIPFMPLENKLKCSEEKYEDCSLNSFERQVSPFVDFGLILFGISNAGVEFSAMSNLTIIICVALIIGKTLGVSAFTYLATLMSFKLPDGMRAKEVVLAGIIAGMGLTVALFVASVAFTDLAIQGAAKMGALFTAVVFIIAPILGKILKIQRITTPEMADAIVFIHPEDELEFDVSHEVDVEKIEEGEIGIDVEEIIDHNKKD